MQSALRVAFWPAAGCCKLTNYCSFVLLSSWLPRSSEQLSPKAPPFAARYEASGSTIVSGQR